jgi:hypothetical protein
LNILKIPKPINFVGANPLWLHINQGRHGGATPTALNILKIPKPINFVGANPLWLPINQGRHGGATPRTPTLNPKVKSDRYCIEYFKNPL